MAFIEVVPDSPYFLQRLINDLIAVEESTGEKLYRSKGRSRSGTGTAYWFGGRRFKAHSDDEAIRIANDKWANRRKRSTPPAAEPGAERSE